MSEPQIIIAGTDYTGINPREVFEHLARCLKEEAADRRGLVSED